MKCRYCGIFLTVDEIPHRMCKNCPQYCESCRTVLPWERIVCQHEDGLVFNYCRDCGLDHLRIHDDA